MRKEILKLTMFLRFSIGRYFY